MKKSILALALATISLSSFSSALVLKSDKDKTLTVSATIIYYGAEANEVNAKLATDEINRMWNEPNAKITLSVNYSVKFEIKYMVIASEAVVQQMAMSNKNPEINFIRLEKNNDINISFYGISDNYGMLVLKDQLGISTTAAHEFGHGLGLEHPDVIDFRGQGNPGIMAPRGTLVDAQFQWNPQAEAGAAGGTLKPHNRRVIVKNVLDLGIEKLNYVNNISYIGSAHNHLVDSHGN